MSWIKKYGLAIARFKGDMPYCLALANIKYESGGNPRNVTKGAGFYEVGFFQSNLGTPSKPSGECRELKKELGLNTFDEVVEFVRTPDGGSWAGGRYYNKRLSYIRNKYDEVFVDEKEADELLWWVTRYGFAIGEYGSLIVFRAALNHGRGKTLKKFLDFCRDPDVADLVPGSGRWQRGIKRWANANEKVFRQAREWAERWGLPLFPTNISKDPPTRYEPKFGTWFEVQEALLKLGYKMPKFGADGWFGNETRNALAQFQDEEKLSVTGMINQETEISLSHCLEQGRRKEEKPEFEKSITKKIVKKKSGKKKTKIKKEN